MMFTEDFKVLNLSIFFYLNMDVILLVDCENEKDLKRVEIKFIFRNCIFYLEFRIF